MPEQRTEIFLAMKWFNDNSNIYNTIQYKETGKRDFFSKSFFLLKSKVWSHSWFLLLFINFNEDLSRKKMFEVKQKITKVLHSPTFASFFFPFLLSFISCINHSLQMEQFANAWSNFKIPIFVLYSNAQVLNFLEF